MNKIKIGVFDISDSIKDGRKIKEYNFPDFIEQMNLAPEFQDFNIETVRFEILEEK